MPRANRYFELFGVEMVILVRPRASKMSSDLVSTARKKLLDYGYKGYDINQFPTLVNTESYIDISGDTPNCLAKALLWKLGKWKVYKAFVGNYNNKDVKVSNKGGAVIQLQILTTKKI